MPCVCACVRAAGAAAALLGFPWLLADGAGDQSACIKPYFEDGVSSCCIVPKGTKDAVTAKGPNASLVGIYVGGRLLDFK